MADKPSFRVTIPGDLEDRALEVYDALWRLGKRPGRCVVGRRTWSRLLTEPVPVTVLPDQVFTFLGCPVECDPQADPDALWLLPAD